MKTQSSFQSRLIPADSILAPTELAPANGTDFQLEELQKVVGGYIQTINLGRGVIMVLNEDGKSMSLPVNERATLMANHVIGMGDFIVGPVAVIRNEQLR